SRDLDVPETVRYKGSPVPQVSGIPTSPNQWWYDSSSDSLYLWLPDSSDPRMTADAVSIFDWRPLMEEIVQVAFDGTAWQVRRLAHHRAQFSGSFGSSPRGNADPTASFVLFQSNWDCFPRSVVFVLMVAPLQNEISTRP